MPHNLEQYGDHTSFAYNGAENPWHRLGIKMDGLATADDMLVAARANYTVTAEPLYVLTDTGMTQVNGNVATVRTVETDDDRDPSDRVLGIVGDNYKIVQNSDVLHRALAIVGADTGDAVVDTCGVLGRGERFFAYVDLGTLAVDPTGVNDKITRGLGVLTSHDGTAAITYAMSNIRWVCNNTVTAGINRAQAVFRARHTTNVDTMLAEARNVLGISVRWADQFTRTAERMLAVNDHAGPGGAHDLMRTIERTLWPLGDDPSRHAQTINDNRTEILHRLLDSPTCGPNFGYNGWSVYNAFVEYADHHRPRLSEDRRAEAAVLGTSDDWKNKVGSLVLAGV
jgi:phage/plasmid-like protein (TIGR03299 family)